MFTGVGPIRARALGFQIVDLLWKQRQAGVLESTLDIQRHLAAKQLRAEDRLTRYDLGKLAPIGLGKRLHLHGYLVRRRARALHLVFNRSARHSDREHLAAACVRPPSLQTRPEIEALQHVDPALGPPRLAVLLRLRANATLRGEWFGLRERAPAMPLAHG